MIHNSFKDIVTVYCRCWPNFVHCSFSSTSLQQHHGSPPCCPALLPAKLSPNTHRLPGRRDTPLLLLGSLDVLGPDILPLPLVRHVSIPSVSVPNRDWFRSGSLTPLLMLSQTLFIAESKPLAVLYQQIRPVRLIPHHVGHPHLESEGSGKDTGQHGKVLLEEEAVSAMLELSSLFDT